MLHAVCAVDTQTTATHCELGTGDHCGCLQRLSSRVTYCRSVGSRLALHRSPSQQMRIIASRTGRRRRVHSLRTLSEAAGPAGWAQRPLLISSAANTCPWSVAHYGGLRAASFRGGHRPLQRQTPRGSGWRRFIQDTAELPDDAPPPPPRCTICASLFLVPPRQPLLRYSSRLEWNPGSSLLQSTATRLRSGAAALRRWSPSCARDPPSAAPRGCWARTSARGCGSCRWPRCGPARTPGTGR